MPNSFLFTVCQAGAEKALKQEVAREHPEFHPAFSRPGFVTFKVPDQAGSEKIPELRSVFARAYGLSVGKAKTLSELWSLAAAQAPLRVATGTPFRLHVFERDFHPPGEEPLGFEPGKAAREAEEKIRAAAPKGLFHPDSLAQAGDWVLDVVVVEPGTAGEPGEWWIGVHSHGAGHSPYPGGAPKIPLPAEAPSRAYLKIEEAQLWAGNPLRKGDVAVEIGSAPGGASYSLLQRGIQVFGIDPAEMDPRVLAHPGFTHVQAPVAAVRREELPEKIQWLLLDMNVAPSITIHQVERLGRLMQDSLLGLFLTVKLNDWAMAEEIPAILERLRGLGMVRLRARQLATNRREVLVYGLTRKGVSRESRQE